MSFSADGSRVAIGGGDGIIHVVAVRGGAVLAQMRGHQGPARAEYVPHGDAIVSAGEEDGTLRTWQPPEALLARHAGTSPRFSPDGRLVVDVADDGAVHLWEPATGKERQLGPDRGWSDPPYAASGGRIASVSNGGDVRVWDAKAGSQRAVPTLRGPAVDAELDPSGARIAIGGVTPLVIQRPDGGDRLRLRASSTRINALAFSPDGMRLLTGGDDGTARIWNARSGALERTLRGHEGIVRNVAYSDDGRSIATAGSDGTIRVWAAKGGDPVILLGHESAVNAARFDRSGRRIVSSGDDGTVRVWDVSGGKALVTLQRYDGVAAGADFGAGQTVVSAGDGIMRITDCEVCGSRADVLRVARTRAQHELSAAERRRLLPSG